MPSNKNTARPTFTYFSSNCMLPGLPRWCQWQRTCLPMQEMWETPRVPPLGREDLSEKETATPSSVLAWEIPWTEEPGGLQSMGSQRVRHDWATKQLAKIPLAPTGRQGGVAAVSILSPVTVGLKLVWGCGGLPRKRLKGWRERVRNSQEDLQDQPWRSSLGLSSLCLKEGKALDS